MRSLVGALVLLAVVVSAGVAGASDGRVVVALDQEEECDFVDTLVPDGATAQLIDDGRIVNLDVVVLLDEVRAADGRTVMNAVADMYEPLDIAIVPQFRKVSFPPEPSRNASGNEWIDSEDLIARSKEVFGGLRPAGSDVVYTMTSKDLDGFTAGRADCIEGIKWPGSAFAVGKYYPPEEVVVGPLTFEGGDSAVVAAHEIGHLLAAEHHEANCAEGGDLAPTDDAAGICTLMFPDTFFIGSRFGAVESTVIRKTALQFARP